MRGPRVPHLLALSDASMAGTRWVGLTARDRNGGVRTFVLRGTRPSDRPRPLGRGDMAAWAPRGDVVVLAHQGGSRDGCRRVSVDVVHVSTEVPERAVTLPHLCGGIVSLGRDINTTYFTARSEGSVDTYSVGIDAVHPVLSGYRLLGVSPAADFLATPAGGRSTAGAGTSLFWLGTGGPIPYGTAHRPLRVDRVLAWSRDGSQAAVLGWDGVVHGVFVLDASAGSDERRLARFVGVVPGRSTFATFASDGTLYLSLDGVLVRYADGVTRQVALPAGVPQPMGPILWLP